MPTDNLLIKAVSAACALALLSLPVLAAQDASKLGTELTPLGGERAAGKDVPAWQGGEKPLSGWSQGKRRRDFWPHKAEKPTATIQAGDVERYATRLSPGQLALFKQLPQYTMDIYPTHRTCGAPDFVAENTKKNVGFASLNADGWSLKDAYLPGIPFPFPTNGAEVMWNTKMRYRGVGFELPTTMTGVSPRRGGNDWIKAGYEQTFFFPWGSKGSTQLSKIEPVEMYTYLGFRSPAALAGQSLVVTISTQAPSETFYYFPGQRRVRRMPSYAYDAPQIGYENQYTLDEPFVFNGLLDRFDWKLVGKKEMYVPYNAFGGYDVNGQFDAVAGKDFVEPDHRRYELHRVWVVEATVKAGMRHFAPKRTFYIDEDSWVLLMAEDHDAQGRIAKVREAFPIPVYEIGACDASAMVQYNLNDGRYLIDLHTIGTEKDVRWFQEQNGARFKSAFYTSDNLRAISDR